MIPEIILTMFNSGLQLCTRLCNVHYLVSRFFKGLVGGSTLGVHAPERHCCITDRVHNATILAAGRKATRPKRRNTNVRGYNMFACVKLMPYMVIYSGTVLLPKPAILRARVYNLLYTLAQSEK